MTASGILWADKGQCSWRLAAPCGAVCCVGDAVWCRVAPCGAVRRRVALHGAVWRRVGPCGAVRCRAAPCGAVWRRAVPWATGQAVWHALRLFHFPGAVSNYPDSENEPASGFLLVNLVIGEGTATPSTLFYPLHAF
eukprot:gene12745-biopygen588